MSPIVGVLISYLAGSIPSAYIAGKLRGIDLRQHGSGNLGATNVVRVLGARIGAIVFIADLLKGFLPVYFLPRYMETLRPELWALVYGVATILGHVKPVFLLGKGGGKGVATASGVFLALAFVPMLIAEVAWISVFYFTRYVSLASLVGAAILPIAMLVLYREPQSPVFIASVVIALFVFWTHRANIGRLRRGEEHKFVKKGKRDLMRCAVVGAGAWGTALADLLTRNGHDVRLWAYEADVVESVNKGHENVRFLGGHKLSPALQATGDIERAVDGAELVTLATPSHVMRLILRSAGKSIPRSAPIVVASKGIEKGTLCLMTEVAEQEIPGATVVALSGPSFAKEVVTCQPTAVVVASEKNGAATAAQRAFSSPYFRAYTHTDVTGVELGGALKNVMAVATGIAEGLGLGFNARAALVTRGLAEMTRLGLALGAKQSTFAGLAGLGDLVLTCTGSLSRNRAVGVEVGRGRTLEEVLRDKETVAEGVVTAQSARELAAREGVEMPIVDTVNRVLFEGQPARSAIAALMTRELRAEVDR